MRSYIFHTGYQEGFKVIISAIRVGGRLRALSEKRGVAYQVPVLGHSCRHRRHGDIETNLVGLADYSLVGIGSGWGLGIVGRTRLYADKTAGTNTSRAWTPLFGMDAVDLRVYPYKDDICQDLLLYLSPALRDTRPVGKSW